jgi:hypothetical protein
MRLGYRNAVVAMVAASMAGLAVVGLSGAPEPSDARDASARSGPKSQPSVSVPVLATGEDWRLLATPASGGVCLHLDHSAGSLGLCPHLWSDPLRPPMTMDLIRSGTSVQTAVFGPVPESTTVASLRLDNGAWVYGQIVRLPPDLGATFGAFVAAIPGVVAGEFVSFDDRGKPSLPGRFIATAHAAGGTGVLDHYGNVVGVVPFDRPDSLENWVLPAFGATSVMIRGAATVPLTKVLPQAWPWWRARPDFDTTDQAFRRWWSAYPVTEAIEPG